MIYVWRSSNFVILCLVVVSRKLFVRVYYNCGSSRCSTPHEAPVIEWKSSIAHASIWTHSSFVYKPTIVSCFWIWVVHAAYVLLWWRANSRNVSCSSLRLVNPYELRCLTCRPTQTNASLTGTSVSLYTCAYMCQQWLVYSVDKSQCLLVDRHIPTPVLTVRLTIPLSHKHTTFLSRKSFYIIPEMKWKLEYYRRNHVRNLRPANRKVCRILTRIKLQK